MGRQPKRNTNQTSKTMPEGQILIDASNASWYLSKCIGKGGFGLIYTAYSVNNKNSNAPSYVIKMEPSESGPLFCEKQVYIRALSKTSLTKWCSDHNLDFLALPRYVGLGIHDFAGDKYRFLVMDMFGKDLQTRIDGLKRNTQLLASEVYKISTDMINALEYLHEHEYVHADIKASNMLLSLEKGSKDRYVLADFGLSFRYIANGTHKKFISRPKKAHNGTIEFTSLDAHVGADPSRRGDLEILGFCMVRWICGHLPWDDVLKVPTKVAELKKQNVNDLKMFMNTCFTHVNIPKGLVEYFKYVEKLEYVEKPDYDKVRHFLSDSGGKPDKKLSKSVKPLHSAKRSRIEIDSFADTESDRVVETTSMNTVEYVESHPSADIKRGRRAYKPVPSSLKWDTEIQTNMDLIKK